MPRCCNTTRRLISCYLNGKRGDTDISEYKKLFDFIQRADLWGTELQDNEDFQTGIYNIFDGIKRELNLGIECNQNDNNCDECNEKRYGGVENPCKECDNCKSCFSIGHRACSRIL